jgi:hypothetical protein
MLSIFSPANTSLCLFCYARRTLDLTRTFALGATPSPPPERTRKLLRRRFGSPSGRTPSICRWVRSQIGTARLNNLIPLGDRASNRLRRSAVPVVTVTNPRRSNGFNAAVNVVRSIASKDATSAIAGGSGRFSDISNENCPFVRFSDRSASSKRRAKARAARCT